MIRKATFDDLDRIMEIYAYAQQFMSDHGNPNQWKRTHPARELIVQDIEEGVCNLLCDGEHIYGVFFYRCAVDPTYDYIEDGEWLNDKKYGVIHRIASDGTHRRVLEAAVEYGLLQCKNLRMDTHHDNIVMQNALVKNGFKRCGIIYLEDGNPRIAYHLIGK